MKLVAGRAVVTMTPRGAARHNGVVALLFICASLLRGPASVPAVKTPNTQYLRMPGGRLA